MNPTRLRRTVLNAFGQFVIVLAGVMGALWAQEIGEERSRLAREAQHLQAIREGIRTARGNLTEVDSVLRGRMDLLERMLTAPDSLMTGPTKSVDSLVYEGLFRLAAAGVDIPAFEDLQSSGELSVIGSEALRIQLQKMDGARATVVTNTDGLARFQENRFDPLIISRTNFAQLMTAFGIDTIPTPGQERDHARLIHDPEVKGLIGFKIGLSRILIRDDATLLSAFDSTLALIDRRLEELGR